MLWQSSFPDMFVVFSTTTQPNTEYTISFWFTYLGRDRFSFFQYTCVQVSAHLQVNNDLNIVKHHFPLLPKDDTASITKGPNSGPSDILQGPQIHASPLHCPVRASSVPVGGANKNIKAKILHFEKEFATVRFTVVQGCIHLFSS